MVIVAYIGLVIYRVNYFFGQDKVAADVAAIHANKLTHEDVYGPLPPIPNEAENNKTLAGVDSNNNGIRDDVEISIYNTHKDSAKTVAAMLQYAKALQGESTSVYNSETLVAVIQEEGRGFLCIGNDDKRSEVENSVLNTKERKDYSEKIRDDYGVSYKFLKNPECDLSF